MKVLSKLLNAKINHGRKIWFVIIGMLSVCISCELNTEEDLTKIFQEQEEDQKSITQHLEENPDDFSILLDILDTTGINHLFRTYGDYTFLAPTNKAFEAYFVEKGKTSYSDFEISELKDLIKYHVFQQSMMAGSFNDGIIGNFTLSLEYMTSGPSIDGSDILFNKESKIISQDWISANGIIHSVDKVIRKPSQNIFEWLSGQGNYSIFVDALKNTGLDKMAQNLVDEFGSREFFTCFVTPDEIYAESNIKSFDDLAKMISPDNSNYNDSSNNMFSFVGSHFLTDILSTSDANDNQIFYGTVGGTTIKFGLIPNSSNLVLNYKTIDFPNGLNVNEFESNNLTKNGIVHIMDTMYLVTKSFQRIRRSFVYVEVPGFPYDSLMDFTTYLWEEENLPPKGGSNPQTPDEIRSLWAQQWPRNNSGIDHIPFERTNGWLTLNAPYSGLIKVDFHRFHDFGNYRYEGNPTAYNPMFFTWEPCDDLLDITRKIPYIIPGRYKLILETKVGDNRPTIKNYFDGKEIGGIINLQTAGLGFKDLELGIVEIKEGEEYHFLRTQTLTSGKGFFVAVKFDPVE